MDFLAKRLLKVACFMLLSNLAFSQSFNETTSSLADHPSIRDTNRRPFRYGIKLINTSTLVFRSLSIPASNGTFEEIRVLSEMNWLSFSPGFQFIRPSRNIHELELQQFDLRSNYGYEFNTTSVISKARSTRADFSYSFFLSLIQTKNEKFSALIGLRLEQEHLFRRRKSSILTDLELDNLWQGLFRAALVPRLAYSSKGRFFADLSFPISLGTMLVSKVHFERAAPLNIDQTNWNVDFGSQRISYSAQISCGIRL